MKTVNMPNEHLRVDDIERVPTDVKLQFLKMFSLRLSGCPCVFLAAELTKEPEENSTQTYAEKNLKLEKQTYDNITVILLLLLNTCLCLTFPDKTKFQ